METIQRWKVIKGGNYSREYGILGASTIILSKDIDKYAFICGSNFYETDLNYQLWNFKLGDIDCERYLSKRNHA